jgi:hypothetical protein
MVRQLICWIMVLVWPASLFAADSGAAMLHSNGKTWINGTVSPTSMAVFPGDLVQTENNSAASISSSGSSVAILPGSLVQFEAGKIGLNHGDVAVTTSKKLATRAGNVIVTPVAGTWTEFRVSEHDGKVVILAQKGDLTVADESGTSTVAAGQQTTRSSDRRRGGAAVPAGSGGILDSPTVIGIGGAAIGALITWALLQGGTPFSRFIP